MDAGYTGEGTGPGLGGEGTGVDDSDRAPSAEAGTRRSDESMGESVGQGAGSYRMEEAAAARGLQEILTEEVGSGAHLLLVRSKPQYE
jgi:hypothetical protein